MGKDEEAARELHDRVRSLVDDGKVDEAVTVALRVLGPDVFGFLYGVLRDEASAEEVFSATSVRLWRSLSSSRFEWRCSLRTWALVLARNEVARFRRAARRHVDGRVPISQLTEVLAAVRTETLAGLRSEKQRRLAALRDELPEEDRALLVLRVDRGLAWEEIALAFTEDPEECTEEERKREAARLRKRFQLIKKRLAERARGGGLLSE